MQAQTSELHSGVALGYGDVVQVASEFSETGEPVWEPGIQVVFSGEDDEDSAPGIVSLGYVGTSRTDVDGCIEPSLTWIDYRTRPVAVKVFGTLAIGEMRALMLKGWSNTPRPEVAVSIFCPEGQQRDPQTYDCLADLSGVTDPQPYIPA